MDEVSNKCNHVFKHKGLHVEGEETWRTSVPLKKLYDVYFCEKCLEEKRMLIETGYHINIPTGASCSGYGFR